MNQNYKMQRAKFNKNGQSGRWGKFSSSTSVSPANLHSTNFSTITITYHPGWYNRPVVAAVPKVPPHKLNKKFNKKISRHLLDQ
jgi:hypothetical protein